MMKRVALFSDGWKRLIVYAWVQGMTEFMAKSDEDIILYQFNCHGNWSTDQKHNIGEYNIYTLPDLSQFDGVIMDCTNITDKAQLDKLVDMIRKSGKPTVSVCMNIDGFFYTGIDNKKSIREMMEHLHDKHGCQKYVFAGGPVENFENSLRVETYLECLDRFGLSRKENPVWYDDFEFSAGVRHFERFIEGFNGGKPEFPDAFVCSNDNIAAGLCYAAQLRGYSVPRDFRVTGFDNLDKAMYFEPQITTVGHMREHIGNNTMKILSDVWAGKEVPKNHFMPSQCIFTESCGCPNSELVNYRSYAKDQIINDVARLSNEDMVTKLEGDIVQCADYGEVFDYMAGYFAKLDCDGFGIVVDKELYDAADENEFAVSGYNKQNLFVAYAVDDGKILDIKAPDKLIEYFDNNGAGSVYMFTPIHFREHTVGYSILKNGRFLYDNPYFYDVHSIIMKTLENLYKKRQLENMNKKLWEIYNRDQLTGLYNRIAYTDMIEPEYNRHCTAGRRCAVCFVDADNFKQINDVYGHERGDAILKEIARVLTDKRPEGGYVYRYGGDEFIAFFPIADEEQAECYRSAVLDGLMKEDISVSIGMALTDPESGKPFDDYLRLADSDMYKVKAARKKKGNR